MRIGSTRTSYVLEQCDYDGRKLAPLLDAISKPRLQQKIFHISLVTGRRNAFKEGGLKGMPLTQASFKAFFEEFNILERISVPAPAKRLGDNELAQIVGTIFIKELQDDGG